MTPAFWDTSALVPLCVQQQTSPGVRRLVEQHGIVVWWSTPVEMQSAFQRLWRMGHLSAPEYELAETLFGKLQRRWRELQPTETLRSQAGTFLLHHPLKAADALQLAAAWTWCSGKTQNRTFIAADAQLLDAARRVGFQTLAL